MRGRKVNRIVSTYNAFKFYPWSHLAWDIKVERNSVLCIHMLAHSTPSRVNQAVTSYLDANRNLCTKQNCALCGRALRLLGLKVCLGWNSLQHHPPLSSCNIITRSPRCCETDVHWREKEIGGVHWKVIARAEEKAYFYLQHKLNIMENSL